MVARARRTLPLAGAVLAIVVLVAVAGILLSHGGSSRTPGPGGSPSATKASAANRPIAVSSTGTDYRSDGSALRRALPGLLAGTATATDSPTRDGLARLREPASLASCLAALGVTDPSTGPGASPLPLALDYARFAGQPALVVVLPSAAADQVDVFVVGADCRTGEDQTLFFTRLPRPSSA